MREIIIRIKSDYLVGEMIRSYIKLDVKASETAGIVEININIITLQENCLTD